LLSLAGSVSKLGLPTVGATESKPSKARQRRRD
jgi:hypothetical protein